MLNKRANKKKCKHQNSYFKFEFTFDVEKGEHHTKCDFCLDRLALESMKHPKLLLHLKTKHPEILHKDKVFFKGMQICYKLKKCFEYFFQFPEKL